MCQAKVKINPVSDPCDSPLSNHLIWCPLSFRLRLGDKILLDEKPRPAPKDWPIPIARCRIDSSSLSEHVRSINN